MSSIITAGVFVVRGRRVRERERERGTFHSFRRPHGAFATRNCNKVPVRLPCCVRAPHYQRVSVRLDGLPTVIESTIGFFPETPPTWPIQQSSEELYAVVDGSHQSRAPSVLWVAFSCEPPLNGRPWTQFACVCIRTQCAKKRARA